MIKIIGQENCESKRDDDNDDDEDKCEDYDDDDDDGDTVCGPYTHGFSILSREWIPVNPFFTLRYIQLTNFKPYTDYAPRGGDDAVHRCVPMPRSMCARERYIIYVYICVLELPSRAIIVTKCK